MDSLSQLFQEQIKDLYSAERQLTRALPRLIKAANSEDLRDALSDHLAETEQHVMRLEKIADVAGFKPSGKMCAGMKGLLEEGSDAAGEDGEPPIIDGAIIAAAQRVEHYEISGYGTARALARQLGHNEAVKLLTQTLDEEAAADEKLTQVAQESIYPVAPSDEADDTRSRKSNGANGARSGKRSGKA